MYIPSLLNHLLSIVSLFDEDEGDEGGVEGGVASGGVLLLDVELFDAWP